MTSLAEGGTGTVLRNRLVWLALALSLTLNVFFIAGLVWSQAASQRQPNFADRLVQAGAELNLSPAQHDNFSRFAETVQQRTKDLREANQPLLRHIWDEFAKAQPDQAVIDRSVDEASDNRHAYQKEVTAALVTFLGSLAPEQRTQFVDSVRHREESRDHPRRSGQP